MFFYLEKDKIQTKKSKAVVLKTLKLVPVPSVFFFPKKASFVSKENKHRQLKRTKESGASQAASSFLCLIGQRGDTGDLAVTKHKLLGRRSHLCTNTDTLIEMKEDAVMMFRAAEEERKERRQWGGGEEGSNL